MGCYHPRNLQYLPPLGARLGLGIQPRYEALGDLQVKVVEERSDLHQVSEAVSSRMTQSWPWDSQIAVKKL